MIRLKILLNNIIYLCLFLLFICPAVESGQKTNPHTRKKDYCVTIETEDLSTRSRACKPLRVTNGTLTDQGSYYSLSLTGAIGLSNVVEDTTPQLGGDLDLNSKNLDFPTTANISDVKDEDNMASDSATMLATQQSIKAYVDAQDHTDHGNGANCNAGEYNLGVDADGAAESCTDATTEINAVVNGLGGTNLTCASQSCNVDDAFIKLGGDVASAGTYNFGSANVILEVPNAAAPTTDATGEMAIDTDLITQGMLQVYLASAIANVVATTDAPNDNEVPTYDSGGGTVQWEAAAGGAEVNNLETVCTDIADDETPVGTAADTVVYKALPDCDGNGNCLNYDTTGNNYSCKTLADADMPDSAAVTNWNLTTPTFTTKVTLDYATASELVSTNASNELVSLAVATYPSLTELSYVKGLTSAIQTQLGTKAPTTAPTFATSITGSYLTASEILITGASNEIISAPVATYPSLTELSYVKGLSSAVQTQITNNAALVDTDDELIAIINASPSTQIKHEAGGLEADVNAYDGLIGITGGATYNQTGTTTQIIIFDGAGAPTSAALSGDATMTNGGVVTIGSDKILEGMLKSVDEAADEECLTYESTTGDFEWQSCGGAGGGITNLNLPIYSAKLTGAFVVFTPPTADACAAGAGIDAGDGNWRLLFDATTDECATWQFVMPDNYASDPKVDIHFSMVSGEADEVEWEAAIMCSTSGTDTADVGTASFSNVAVGTATTVSATAGEPYVQSITITDDSCAASDVVWLVISTDANDATSDDATGDREVIGVEFNYTGS